MISTPWSNALQRPVGVVVGQPSRPYYDRVWLCEADEGAKGSESQPVIEQHGRLSFMVVLVERCPNSVPDQRLSA